MGGGRGKGQVRWQQEVNVEGGRRLDTEEQLGGLLEGGSCQGGWQQERIVEGGSRLGRWSCLMSSGGPQLAGGVAAGRNLEGGGRLRQRSSSTSCWRVGAGRGGGSRRGM